LLDAAWDHNPYFSPWTLKAVCIGSILMLSGLLWATRLSSEGKFVVYAAFSIQTNMGYLALVQPAHYRYVIPLMPLVIVFTIGMAAMTWLWAYRQLLVPIQPHLRSCHPESVAISPRKEAQLHAAISSAIDTEDYSHAGNVRKSGQSLT